MFLLSVKAQVEILDKTLHIEKVYAIYTLDIMGDDWLRRKNLEVLFTYYHLRPKFKLSQLTKGSSE